MNAPGRLLLPLIILFLAISVLIFTSTTFLQRFNIDKNVLLVSNALLFVISVLSFFMQRRGLQNKNPNVFVRSVMGGMMVKMLICVIALVIYISFIGSGFNKRGVFISLFLYLIYLSVEVFVVMKMNKNKKTDG